MRPPSPASDDQVVYDAHVHLWLEGVQLTSADGDGHRAIAVQIHAGLDGPPWRCEQHMAAARPARQPARASSVTIPRPRRGRRRSASRHIFGPELVLLISTWQAARRVPTRMPTARAVNVCMLLNFRSAGPAPGNSCWAPCALQGTRAREPARWAAVVRARLPVRVLMTRSHGRSARIRRRTRMEARPTSKRAATHTSRLR